MVLSKNVKKVLVPKIEKFIYETEDILFEKKQYSFKEYSFVFRNTDEHSLLITLNGMDIFNPLDTTELRFDMENHVFSVIGRTEYQTTVIISCEFCNFDLHSFNIY